MSIDIKTAAIEPLRTTFDHLERRLGPGVVPTRYQEVVFDVQATTNFHYRPTWDPEREVYDPRRTALHMEDWEQLLDPRQYYYGSYLLQRARQRDTQEQQFAFVEKRELLASLAPPWREKVSRLLVPLRHFEWGANLNNCFIAAYGYGAPVTSAATFQTLDRLGNAQYLSRLGLLLGENDTAVLDAAKRAWLDDPMWQPLRRLLEDAMVLDDWFELHVVQNLLADSALHPLLFAHFDRELAAAAGGTAVAMLSEFTVAWYAESVRWTDAVLARAAAESEGNRERIAQWCETWRPRAWEAAAPLAGYALGAGAEAALDAISAELDRRLEKAGVAPPPPRENASGGNHGG